MAPPDTADYSWAPILFKIFNDIGGANIETPASQG
jgi:hypothetical protein